MRLVCASVLVAIASLLSLPARAAEPAGGRFLASDVHPSPKRLHAEFRISQRGDRLALRDATMLDLISDAYNVDPSSVFGGPSWLAFDKFDITALLPPGTPHQAINAMTRALLAERFGLIVETGTRPLPAFVLSAGKSVKLRPAASSAEEGCRYQPPAPDQPPTNLVRFACHNAGMAELTGLLHEVATPYLNHPVLDQTGLKGAYDFEIEWTYRVPREGDGVTIFQALERQLGLKLAAATAPLPVVVVKAVSQTPTPNAPGVATLLPPAPAAQFDVAVIRPAKPGEKNFRLNVDGGEVTIQYSTLHTLITTAYDINQLSNKPPWLNLSQSAQRYDITGKVAMDTAGALPGHTPDLDIDDVKEMLRSLLADRFKLVTHMGSEPADVFALVAAGPKMKKADPANHPSCKEGPGADGKDPRLENPLLNRLVSCQNMTMADLAEQLHNLAGGYVPSPVIDETRLDGAYDFSISFSKNGDQEKTLTGRSPGGDEQTLTGLSLPDALRQQLGLKLEKRSQVPRPVLVIDHVEQNPTEN